MKEIVNAHKLESEKFAEALNKNTIVLERLSTMIDMTIPKTETKKMNDYRTQTDLALGVLTKAVNNDYDPLALDKKDLEAVVIWVSLTSKANIEYLQSKLTEGIFK